MSVLVGPLQNWDLISGFLGDLKLHRNLEMDFDRFGEKWEEPCPEGAFNSNDP